MIDGLGERLYKAYKQSGLTVRQIAEKAGIGVNTMHEVITGKSDPRLSTLILLCDALGCSLEWLLGLDDDCK
jgi:transcriptional regulator with XRE-family HTH domain